MSDISFVFENDFVKYRSAFEKVCPPPLLVKKGTELYKQCAPGGWMYYLTDGIVKVYISNYQGNDRIIDYMKQNTIVGMDSIDPKWKSIVSTVCLTDTHVLPFNSDILKLMLKDPDFAYDLVLYYGKVLRQVTFDAGNLSINNLTARLANFLYLFYDTPGYRQTQKIEMTQNDLASAINISRAQVAKICAHFRKEGMIQTGNRSISILDIEKLKSYCSF